MTSTWRVDSFHANVAVGDCAIHLQVEYDATTMRVHAAVLIDGGTGHKSDLSKTPLKQLIDRINGFGYTFKYKTLVFDSVVVTHWDEDHYGGLVKTFAADRDPSNGKLPYMKYDTNNTPMTILYAPNATGSGKGYNGISKDWTLKKDYLCFEDTSKPFARFQAFEMVQKKPVGVLGTNFFNNQQLQDMYGASTPAALIASNPPGDGMPGIYCVGVMQQSFPKKGFVGVVQEPVTKTNKVSIAAMIIWSSGTDPPHISHYFAGDMDQTSEEAVLAWLVNSKKQYQVASAKLSHHGSRSSTPLDFFGVLNPSNIIMSNPDGRYFHPGWETIITGALYADSAAAKGNTVRLLATKYPFYFVQDEKGLYPILTRNKMFLTNGRLKTFDKPSKHAKVFIEWLTNAWKSVSNANHMPYENEYDLYQYWDEKKGTDPLAAYANLLDRVKKRWEQHGWPLADRHPAVSTAYTAPMMQKVSSVTGIQFILVISSIKPLDSRYADGSVFYGERSGSVQRLEPPGATQATATSDVQANTGANSFGGNISLMGPTLLDFAKILDAASWQVLVDYLFYLLEAGDNPDELDDDGDDDSGGGMSIEDDFHAPLVAFRTLEAASTSGVAVPSPNTSLATTSGMAPVLPTPPGDPANPWYFFSSEVTDASINQQQPGIAHSYGRLSNSKALDAFVSLLHCKVLCLDQEPPPTAVGTTLFQQTKDEWACWLQDAVNASEISVLNGADKSIAGFALALNLAGPNDPPVLLQFNTKDSTLQNIFATISATPAMGLLSNPSGVVLGLDLDQNAPLTRTSQTPATVPFANIINFLNLQSMFGYASMAIFKALEFELPTLSGQIKGKRNAVWFQPETAYRTTVRFELDLSSNAIASLNGYLSAINLQLQEVFMIARKTCTWSPGSPQVNVKQNSSLVLGATATLVEENLSVITELNPNSIRLRLTLDSPTKDFFADLRQWLSSTFLSNDPQAFSFTAHENKSAGGNTFGEFDFRRLTLDLSHDPDTNKAKFVSLCLEMQLTVTPSGASAQPLLFLVNYQYTTGAGSILNGSSIEADLWTAPVFDPNNPFFVTTPDYETYALLKPIGTSSWPASLDLKSIGGFDQVPDVVPTLVTQARLYADANGIMFSGALQAAPNSSGTLPIFEIDEIDLKVAYAWGAAASGSGSSFTASLYVSSTLNPPAGVAASPAYLTGAIEFSGNQWVLQASAQSLYASCFTSFFEKDVQDTVISIIGSIEIESFSVKYTYPEGKGVASVMQLDGTMNIGALQFTLDFHHEEKEEETEWYFRGRLSLPEGASSVPTTIGDVLASVVGPDLDLPSFVADINVNPTATDTIGLDMVRITDASKKVTGYFFTTYIIYGDFRFQYIQLRDLPSESSSAPALKRIFIASINSLPSVDIPLVGDVTQPFDEAYFMWVQPQTGSDGITSADTTAINKQIDALNTAETLNLEHIMFQQVKNPKELQPGDTVIQNGMHLALVLKDDTGTPKVVLDYCFGGDKSAEPSLESGHSGGSASPHPTGDVQPIRASDPPAPAANDPPAPPPSAAGSKMVGYEKSFGPLAVRNLGFNYSKSDDDQTDILSIKVDATITLGPVAFELMGFRLDLEFPVSPPGTDPFTLHNLPTPKPHLDGMAVVFDKPPLLMGGMFMHGTMDLGNGDKTDFYEGAISIAYQPWAFQANGYYGITTGLNPFKTAFVYCILAGPLISLEFAEISSVTGGFGYNSNLKLPDVNNVQSFPFLQIPSPVPAPEGTGPLAALNALLDPTDPTDGWFAQQEGSFWAAAGLTVTAFGLLTATAVVVVEWDPSVKLGIFGLVTGNVPMSAGNGGFTMAHIQMGIVATVDVAAGIMKIDGQLTPESYIYAPEVHLTGGFALYSWFGDGDPTLKGDWVFTIGGYHPAFVVPPHYPQPPRLAISWQFNDDISISGQAYFAITPKVCMGGGRLDVSLSVGVLYAWFDAFADFLINYKPFHFIAEGGVSVGVKFTLDLWIVTIHISVELGATLFIAGPPLYGTVHVDFWVFGFDINFGSSDNDLKALHLAEFITLVCQADLNPSSTTMLAGAQPAPRDTPRVEEVEDDDDKNVPHVFSIETGVFPQNTSKSKPNTERWYVRAATFSFRISCKFAIDNAEIVTLLENGESKSVTVPGTSVDIHAKPMQGNADKVTSELVVTITPQGSTPTHNLLAAPPAPDNDEFPVWNLNTAVIKDLPTAIWGPYSPTSDPSTNYNPKDLMNGTTDKTVSLMSGVVLTRPGPALSTEDETLFPAFEFETAQIDDDIPHRPFPPLTPDPGTFSPSQPGTKGAEWTALQDAWSTPLQKGAPGAAVETWVEVGLSYLGWDAKKMDDKQGMAPVEGAIPSEIVGNLPVWYMWAPMVGVAA